MYFADADEMAHLDEMAIKNGLEVRQMMELAGWAMVSLFQRLDINNEHSVCVVCGVGNKAGDGLSAARHLHNYGFPVSVILVGAVNSEDAKHHLSLVEQLPVQIHSVQDAVAQQMIENADVIIDAMIGYNLDGPPRSPFDRVVEVVNKSEARVIAYDLPTGLDPTSGEVYKPCIDANETLSLALPKAGFKHGGADVSGPVYVADIGIPSVHYTTIRSNSRPGFDMDGLIQLED
jgi:NAD(P)H-hydrate epimerase